MFERIEKMDRRTLATIAIAALVGILLFGAIASGIRQAGWNEGFLVGQLSSGAQASAESGAAASPYLAARGYGGMHGWGWHPFGLIGGFFRFLFFGFLIMMLFKFFAFRRWARHSGYRGGYPGGPWGRHGRHHWGHHGEEGQPGNSGEQAQGTPPTNAPMHDPMPTDMNRPQQTSWTQV